MLIARRFSCRVSIFGRDR